MKTLYGLAPSFLSPQLSTIVEHKKAMLRITRFQPGQFSLKTASVLKSLQLHLKDA